MKINLKNSKKKSEKILKKQENILKTQKNSIKKKNP